VSKRGRLAGEPSDQAPPTMITSTKGPIVIGDVFFKHEALQRPVDILRFNQVPTPVEHARCVPFHTRILALDADEDDLQEGFSRDLRYELRRAARDGIRCGLSTLIPAKRLAAFCDYFDLFAAQKRIRSANRAKLAALSAANALVLSWAEACDGKVLAWHAYVVFDHRARLLHSFSPCGNNQGTGLRQSVGRANRALHWEDMRQFKASGITMYDFGGWYEGGTDQERLRINSFKGEFARESNRGALAGT
jgi:hypothetical protein